MKQFRTVKKISLKARPDVTEEQIQRHIKEDPSILGLGELSVRDIERVQPGAGRMDLLLEEIETNRRYEVELQLGRTDESHIIRTIEYWDIERKRYPQYDHCAVLIAEDITSRFLNIVQLLNGHVPLIAMQMEAFDFDDHFGLFFTKILDELKFGYVEDAPEDLETVDRRYWEDRATPETVLLADQVLDMLQEIDSNLQLKYNRHYIGLTQNGKANNFIQLRPKKKHIGMGISLPKSEEMDEIVENAAFDSLDYDRRQGRYRLQLLSDDLEANRTLLKDILKRAYDNWDF